MAVSRLLPTLLELLTGHPRYKPEVVWSDSVAYNLFRLYERVFWRKVEIRREVTAQFVPLENGKSRVIYQFHTLEAALVYFEGIVRRKFTATVPVRAYVPVLAPAGAGVLPSLEPYLFAVARDTSASYSAGASASSQTISYTLTGSNPFLTMGILSNNVGTDTVSGVTWAGSAMTEQQQDTTNSNARWTYYKFGGSTGTQNIVISYSPNDSAKGVIASYSGVNSGLDNSSNNSSTGTSFTDSITPVASGCWAVEVFINIDNANTSGGTGANAVVGNNTQTAIYDSNGTITAGVSYSMTVTASGATRNMMRTLMTIAPFANNYSKTLTETLTASDSLIRQISRSLSESLAHSETLTTARLRFQTLTDSISFADTLLRSVGKVLSEALTATDSFIRSAFRSLVETITNSDTLQKLAGRTLTDSVTHQDSLTRTPGKVLADTLTAVDTFIRSAFRTLSETVSLTDTVAKLRTAFVTLSERMTLLDRKLKPLLNGVLGWYRRKYSTQSTNYSEKYSSQATNYDSKYSSRGSNYQEKYD